MTSPLWSRPVRRPRGRRRPSGRGRHRRRRTRRRSGSTRRARWPLRRPLRRRRRARCADAARAPTGASSTRARSSSSGRFIDALVSFHHVRPATAASWTADSSSSTSAVERFVDLVRRCSSFARSASNVAVAESSSTLTRAASSSRDSDSGFMASPFCFVAVPRRTYGGGPGHRIPENPSLRRVQRLGRSTSASWVREVTPSFTKTFRRWYSTVLVVM